MMKIFLSLVLLFCLWGDGCSTETTDDGHIAYITQIRLIDAYRVLPTADLRSLASKNIHNLFQLNAIVYAALEREHNLRLADLTYFLGMAYIINSTFGSNFQQVVVSRYVHTCPLSWNMSDMLDFAKQQEWDIDPYLLDVEFHRWRIAQYH